MQITSQRFCSTTTYFVVSTEDLNTDAGSNDIGPQLLGPTFGIFLPLHHVNLVGQRVSAGVAVLPLESEWSPLNSLAVPSKHKTSRFDPVLAMRLVVVGVSKNVNIKVLCYHLEGVFAASRETIEIGEFACLIWEARGEHVKRRTPKAEGFLYII